MPLRCSYTLVLAAFTFFIPIRSSAQTAGGPAAPSVTVSGYLQPQYAVVDDGNQSRDRIFFRRIMLTVDANGQSGWNGEFQVDAGPIASGGNRLIVKNAFLQYSGWRDRGVTMTIGNQKLPFSRSYYGSSSRRGLIERPFTGDRAFGTPGRALAIKAEGSPRSKTVYWAAALAATTSSADGGEIRLDGPAEAGTGLSEGPILAGRVEFHPLGEVLRDHGDFARGSVRFTVGAAAYRWWNDDDVSPQQIGSVNASHATGGEISGGLRGHGVSVEAELERITVAAIDRQATSDLYSGGEAALNKASVEVGYMFVPAKFEWLASADMLDAATFASTWQRLSVGINAYVNGHRLKFSLMHRESFNDAGTDGARSRQTFIQSQFAF
ncbi:MAG: porin [Vicinamibacterales bacterium]